MSFVRTELAPLPARKRIALAREPADELRAFLAGLPSAQPGVVELRLAGLSGREIAQGLGRSGRAVELEESKLAIALADEQLDSERQRTQLLGERSGRRSDAA